MNALRRVIGSGGPRDEEKVSRGAEGVGCGVNDVEGPGYDGKGCRMDGTTSDARCDSKRLRPIQVPYAQVLLTLKCPTRARRSSPLPRGARMQRRILSAILVLCLPLAYVLTARLVSHPRPSLTPETKSLAPTTPNIDDESAESEMEDDHLPGLQSNRANMSEKHSHPRSPYRAGSVLAGKSGKVKESVPFPSRSHASLPPVQRMNQVNASSQSLGRQSGLERDRVRDRDKDRDRKDSAKTTPTVHSRLLRRPKRSQTQPDASLHAIPPHLLPEDLRICLEVIERIP